MDAKSTVNGGDVARWNFQRPGVQQAAEQREMAIAPLAHDLPAERLFQGRVRMILNPYGRMSFALNFFKPSQWRFS